jgi:FmdE protein associated with molybdenum formylmethanofuran dehydrogenase
MNYPDFFDTIPAIRLHDPLSALLGTFAQGELTITYLDVIKGSGHSCPTVAGAYLMSYHALQALYPQSPAVRGNISVQFMQAMEEGTTGVVSNVISYITGATDKNGFKGLGGNFIRHSLMAFEQKVPSVRFTRIDTQESVDLFYEPNVVEADPKQMTLMKEIMQEKTTVEEKKEFGRLWQERVKHIMIDNFDNPKLIRVEKV